MGVRECGAIAVSVVAAGLAVATAAGCRTPAYAPCPVELAAPLPADAFQRCRDVLRQRYGRLEVVDAGAFRLQSGWSAIQDPAGEQRATVFREDAAGENELVVVVEVRWPAVPLLGAPSWTGPRGDAAAERELAALLRDALTADATAR